MGNVTASDWTQIGMFWTTVILAMTAVAAVAVSVRTWRAQIDPCVIMYVRRDEARPMCLDLIVQNVGKGLARNIELEWSGALPIRAFQSGHAELDIKHIPALGPGVSWLVLWGEYDALENLLGSRVTYVTCKFFNHDGKELPPVVCPIEHRSFGAIDATDADGARQCAKELRRIGDALAKAVADFDSPKTAAAGSMLRYPFDRPLRSPKTIGETS